MTSRPGHSSSAIAVRPGTARSTPGRRTSSPSPSARMPSSPTSSRRRTACSCCATRTRSPARPMSPSARSSPPCARRRSSTGASSPAGSPRTSPGRAVDAARRRSGSPTLRRSSATFDGTSGILRLRDLLDIIDAASERSGRPLGHGRGDQARHLLRAGGPSARRAAGIRTGRLRAVADGDRLIVEAFEQTVLAPARGARACRRSYVYLLEKKGRPSDLVAALGEGGSDVRRRAHRCRARRARRRPTGSASTASASTRPCSFDRDAADGQTDRPRATARTLPASRSTPGPCAPRTRSSRRRSAGQADRPTHGDWQGGVRR